ncbi:MAG: hypothetical protein RBT65_12335 [Methanolobus sp.]|nr:hypothetical protein [Methanolobus sp.]
MDHKKSIVFVALVSMCLLVSGCSGPEMTTEITGNHTLSYKDANLTLTLTPETINASELSNLQLGLKNEGKYPINVDKFRHQCNYKIIYADGWDVEYESMPMCLPIGDDSLIEIMPGESYTVNVDDAGHWQGQLRKGNQSISVVYYPSGSSYTTHKFWTGKLRSNNITYISESFKNESQETIEGNLIFNGTIQQGDGYLVNDIIFNVNYISVGTKYAYIAVYQGEERIEEIKIYEGETRIFNYENSPRIALKLIDIFEEGHGSGNFLIIVENSQPPLHDSGIIDGGSYTMYGND